MSIIKKSESRFNKFTFMLSFLQNVIHLWIWLDTLSLKWFSHLVLVLSISYINKLISEYGQTFRK